MPKRQGGAVSSQASSGAASCLKPEMVPPRPHAPQGNGLVPKVASPREDHRDAVLVARLDGLVVTLGATGLNDRRHAVLGQHVHVVTEREERV